MGPNLTVYVVHSGVRFGPDNVQLLPLSENTTVQYMPNPQKTNLMLAE